MQLEFFHNGLSPPPPTRIKNRRQALIPIFFQLRPVKLSGDMFIVQYICITYIHNLCLKKKLMGWQKYPPSPSSYKVGSLKVYAAWSLKVDCGILLHCTSALYTCLNIHYSPLQSNNLSALDLQFV